MKVKPWRIMSCHRAIFPIDSSAAKMFTTVLHAAQSGPLSLLKYHI